MEEVKFSCNENKEIATQKFRFIIPFEFTINVYRKTYITTEKKNSKVPHRVVY